MANSKLQGTVWDIPNGKNGGPNIIGKLKRNFNAYKGPKNVEGYERLRDLVSSDTISYELLKGIKNFFDTYTGKPNGTPYILNGGSMMEKWVNKTLSDARNKDKLKDRNMKDTGMEKNSNVPKPSKISKPHSSNFKQTMGEGVREMDIMKNLINNINKNRKLWHIKE